MWYFGNINGRLKFTLYHICIFLSHPIFFEKIRYLNSYSHSLTSFNKFANVLDGVTLIEQNIIEQNTETSKATVSIV